MDARLPQEIGCVPHPMVARQRPGNLRNTAGTDPPPILVSAGYFALRDPLAFAALILLYYEHQTRRVNLREQVIVAAGLFFYMGTENQGVAFEERGKTNQALVELLIARGLGGILNLLRRARNVCAHHSRFWNRRINAGVSSGLGSAPEIAPFEECLRAVAEQKGTSAFVTLSLAAYCMSVFRPESNWKNRCRDFLAKHDAFVLRGMGFPVDWQELALWK